MRDRPLMISELGMGIPSEGITPYASSLAGLGGMPNVAPAPMQYFGQRWSPETNRLDSPDAKSTGFLGTLVNRNGDVVSEYSTSSPIGGNDVEYPTVVPGLSMDQIRALLTATENHQPVPHDIAAVAYGHALKRLGEGLSPFWNTAQDAWPKGGR